MAEYNDLAEIDRLSKQQATISQALMILEDYGGTISSYTVSPVLPPDVMGSPSVMPTMITSGTAGEELLTAVHGNLVAQYDDLSVQLTALGVTGAPPAHTGARASKQKGKS